MIGTRTARTVVFGLLGIVAGLLFPVASAARPATVATIPVVRAAGTDVRTPDDLSRVAPANRVGESEVRSGQPPIPALLPKRLSVHPIQFVMVVVLVLSMATLTYTGPNGARAPPRLAL